MKVELIHFGVLMAAAGTALSTFAAPEISNVTQSRNDETHLVTISYDLSETAIVTAQVLVNGEKLSPDTYGILAGKVHRTVAAGTGHQIWWKVPAGLAANAEVKLSAWAKDDPPDYMAIDMITVNHRRFYETAEDVPGGVTNRLYKTDKLLMRKIYAKNVQWPMGASSDVTYALPQHKLHMVTLTTNYYISVYEMTKRQYGNITDSFKRAENIVTDDVRPHSVSYSTMRGSSTGYLWPTNGHKVHSSSQIAKIRSRTGLMLDLPTEAQWEYACRAGEPKALYTGESFNGANVSKIAWYGGNWNQDPEGEELKTHEVGLLLPNKWGLYDMLGNGSDVCLDGMGNNDAGTDQIDPYQGEPAEDPLGPLTGTSVGTTGRHARRGGAVASTSGSTTKATLYTTCGAHYRENLNYSAGYTHLGYRMTMPAIIP